jgi:hypothetical protein
VYIDGSQNINWDPMNKFRHVLLVTASLVIVGCGLSAGTTAPNAPLTRTQGIVHGGPNPIVGATVTRYETQVGVGANTYFSPGKVSATTTTGSNGQFAFTNTGAGTYTCDTTPYMQYAYVVTTGGNTGANSTNNNEVLVAALGACSNLSTVAAQCATTIFISEATTLAAAYALSNFASVSGPLGGQTVNVGSSVTNDATIPDCTGTGSAMVCVADGPGHAFDNAAGLASSVSFNGSSPPTGLFNVSMPGYATSSIPQAMLNTVADALQVCVNSSGGSAGDSTGCGMLFTDTMPTGGVASTDTFSTAINIAKYPSNPATITASGTSTGIYSIVSATAYFQPTLVAAPTDYSLGVFYPGGSNFPYAWSLALDAADNVYVMAANGNTTTTGASSVVTQSGIAAIGYNSQGQTSLLYGYYGNADTNYTIPVFLQWTPTATYSLRIQARADRTRFASLRGNVARSRPRFRPPLAQPQFLTAVHSQSTVPTTSGWQR